jgi:hypothetical protein
MGDRHRTCLKVGDVVFGVDFPATECPGAISRTYLPFVTSEEPDMRIVASTSAMPPVFPLESHRVFDAWDKWSIYRIDGQTLLVQRHAFSSAIPDRVMVIDPDFRQGELFLRSSGSIGGVTPCPLDYPLGQVLMAWLLSQGHGLMVHACGVNDNGRGYLLAGNSGHGKSTLAAIWEKEADVLNDDRMVVRKKDGRFWMYGTPWSGSNKSVSAYGVPVEKIFFLKQGAGYSIEHVGGARAVSMILARSFPPIWDAQGMAFTLDFLSELTSQVPCHEFTFSAGEEVKDVIRCVK